MKIEEVHIRNFKNLSDVTADLGGHSLCLLGPNQSGKTSFVQAIYVALTGKEVPDEAISRGALKSEIDVTLAGSGERIRVHFELRQGKKEITRTLEIIDPNGVKVASGQRTWLNTYLGATNIDVEMLFNLPQDKMMKKIAQGLGIDTDALDNELKLAMNTRRERSSLMDVAQAVYDSNVNNASNEAMYRSHGFNSILEFMAKMAWRAENPETYDEHIQFAMNEKDRIMEKLGALGDPQTKIDAITELYAEKLKTITAEYDTVRTGASNLVIKNTEREKAIKQNLQRIKELEEENDILTQNIARDTQSLGVLQQQATELTAKYTETENLKFKEIAAIEATDLTVQREVLQDAATEQESFIQGLRDEKVHMTRTHELLALSNDLGEKTEAYNEADQYVATIRNRKATMIQLRIDQLGISDLSYDMNTEEFKYQGFVLDPLQVNRALLIELSLRLMCYNQSKLRIIRIYDASLLDEDTRSRVLEFAKAHDYQLFLEIAEKTPDNGLHLRVIEDDYITIPV